ncbi:TPA: class I SAM-dependent methyltransferase [Candidatus Woesearchaeota archaeon]|nr:class I SAM-dependent methyltransferase [Candidatus Woesearchaeota archaeon]
MLKRVFTLLRCDGCGLVFVSPRLTRAEVSALYSPSYFQGDGFDAAVDYVSLLDNYDAAQRESDYVLERIRVFSSRKDLRILDVGCATGSLLRVLERKKYASLLGIELSPYAAGLARKNCTSPVITGDFLKHDFGDRQFDVIVSTEVIEHVTDPMRFFRRVKRLLAPGGVFICSTGNVRSLAARLLGKRWHYIAPEGHLFYFSPTTLSRYYAAVGLESVEYSALDGKHRKKMLRIEDNMLLSILDRSMHNNDRRVEFVLKMLRFLPRRFIGRVLTIAMGKYRLPMAKNGIGIVGAGKVSRKK